MVHQGMGKSLRGADELYMNRVLLALEDFLFFALYSFSCEAKASHDFETASTLVLS